MRRLWKIAVCLAGGLALNAGLFAANLRPQARPAPIKINNPVSINNPSPDGPYSTIAVRNIFGLIPPAPPAAPEAPENNLPKITPTGIMGVFGDWQVLFKVAAAVVPGQPPAKDDFYILSEGQRQDDIEVIKIDEKKSLVTFDNHGTTQELPLANAPSAGGAGPSPGAGMNPGMAAGRPGYGGNGPGGFTPFGAGSGGNNGGSPNSNPGSNGGGPGVGLGVNSDDPTTDPHIYHPQAPTMSREDSEAMIIINHLKAQTAGDPTASLFPPMPHDAEAGVNSTSQ